VTPPGRPAAVDLASEAGRTVLRLSGDLTLDGTPALWAQLDETLARAAAPLVVDVSAVGRCDSAGAAMLLALRERFGDVSVVGANEQVASALRLADRGAQASAVAAPEPRRGLVERAGAWAVGVGATVRDTFGYIGDLCASLARAVVHPSSVRWRDTVQYMGRTGSDALGIVALIGFLIGWILAFQGAAQLSRFGVESYVADAVGVGIVMELGPLMTAIIVAGRSGSAFAAEIATMKVNEEVDALDTMGLDRTRFLVTPKVVALLLMMPLLVVFADACGILGGMLVGVTSLGMTVETYLRRTGDIVDLRAVAQGMIKGEAYALVIASIGCLRGLETKQGAQGVGLATTSAVVTAILFLILADATLTTVFHYAWP
jgi:phospholipid/cholesterol/gamma-HCH transport system permease protein